MADDYYYLEDTNNSLYLKDFFGFDPLMTGDIVEAEAFYDLSLARAARTNAEHTGFNLTIFDRDGEEIQWFQQIF